MSKKSKKKLVGILGVLLIAALGATFAYFNQTLTAENPFETGKYDSVLTEDFVPEDNWEPGATVDKVVAVENTGDYPIVIRAKFDDSWFRKDASGNASGDAYKTVEGRDGSTSQADAEDGLWADDGSVAKLIFNGSDGVADGWTYDSGDGYWYYDEVLPAGESTDAFLTAVKLLEDVDMGKYTVTKYYTELDTKPEKDAITGDASTGWEVYTTDEVPKTAKHSMTTTTQVEQGYSSSIYHLLVTAQTVQATKAAAESAFGASHVPSAWNLQ